MNRGEDNVLSRVSPRCCSMSIAQREVNSLNANLPNAASKTSKLPSEVNKLNSNLPSEANETRKLPTEASKRNSNTYT